MDTVIGALWMSVIMGTWIWGIGMMIRYRIIIAQWLKAPGVCESTPISRKTILERRLIKLEWQKEEIQV